MTAPDEHTSSINHGEKYQEEKDGGGFQVKIAGSLDQLYRYKVYTNYLRNLQEYFSLYL